MFGIIAVTLWMSQAAAPMSLAQVYGTRCQVPGGICFIPAQPIGSVCSCGNAQGFVIN